MKELIKNKKGQVLNNLGALGIGIASLAIILVVAFLIMSQARTQIGSIEGYDGSNATQCDDSISCNATTTLQTALDDVPGWVPIIVITAIGAILIGMVKLFKR